MRSMLALVVAASVAFAQESKGKMPDQGKGVDVGKDATDFKLKKVKKDDKEKDVEVKLSDFKEKKPVVLIFGSYT